MQPGDLIRMIPWTIDELPQWFGIVIETGVPLFETPLPGHEDPCTDPCTPDAVRVHWGSAGIDKISTDEIEVVSESR